jgi:hypothetical protein
MEFNQNQQIQPTCIEFKPKSANSIKINEIQTKSKIPLASSQPSASIQPASSQHPTTHNKLWYPSL